MECKRKDLKKDKKGNYTHKACSSQSTSNAHCRDCCDCKHPEDGSTKRVKCKNKCDKKLKNYAPEPSNQYELDSFEIGTESDEIHGLESHDEYEEVEHGCPRGKCPLSNGNCGRCPPGLTYHGPPGLGKKKKKKKKYTSEPMPDYIMRALQPKKSVHSVYGKLRYKDSKLAGIIPLLGTPTTRSISLGMI